MHKKIFSIFISVLLLCNTVFVYPHEINGTNGFLSPKSNIPSRRILRYLRVLVADSKTEVREIAQTWNPVKIGLDAEISPDNIRPRGSLPENTLTCLNEALRIIKKRSSNTKFGEFFKLDIYGRKGLLGRIMSQKYLLQNFVFFEGPFLADMFSDNNNNDEAQTTMLNLILFSDLVKSVETIVYVLRHEMDHSDPLTERQIKDRDMLYFKSLPKKAQDEIIEDLGRIEEGARVVEDSIITGAYRERTGDDNIEKLQRYREILLLAQREGLSERSKNALREFIGMKRASVNSSDGVTISYTLGGKLDSPVTLLFLHGWISQSKDWRRQIVEFESDYRIVTIDMRGFGNSGQGNYTNGILPDMNDFAGDVKAVINAEGLDNIVILGHSMGGMVGFNLCLDDEIQDKVIGFIPIATTAVRPSESFINTFFSGLAGKLEPAFKATLSFITKKKAVALLDLVQKKWLRNNPGLETLARIPSQIIGLSPQDRKSWHHLWTNCVGETNLREWLIGYIAMSTHDVVDRLCDINVPVLWVAGVDDRLTDFKAQRRQAEKIPDVKFVSFEKSGHFVHWDKPGDINVLIRDFLSRKLNNTGRQAGVSDDVKTLEETGRYKPVTAWREIDEYVQQLIDKGDKPERVLLDLDMTVFAARGYVGSNAWFNNVKNKLGIFRALWGWGDSERRMTRHGFYRLMDDRIPEIIKRWKDHGIEVVGFTARQWTKDGSRTMTILKKIGVNFSQIRSFSKIYYDRGVIYTFGSGESKVKALRSLTENVGKGTTVFIDDSMVNISRVVLDTELTHVHGLLYSSPFLDELMKMNANDYFELAQDAVKGGKPDYAIEYLLNAAAKAGDLDINERFLMMRNIWKVLEGMSLSGTDAREAARFLIKCDETKRDLSVMDDRMKDPFLNLLAEKPPVTDTEKTKILCLEIDENVDFDILMNIFRLVKEVRRQDRYPKFRIAVKCGKASKKMRKRIREAGMEERIDYDLLFVPKKNKGLLDVFRSKKGFRDLKPESVSEGDVINIDLVNKTDSYPELVYRAIAGAERYSVPETDCEVMSPFSRIDLTALREKAKKKIKFLNNNYNRKPIVLFHHIDSDGIAAAAAEAKFLKDYFGKDVDIRYVPLTYSTSLSEEDMPQDSMWIVVDFNYQEFSKKLQVAGIDKKEILFQDHHDESDPEIPDEIVYITPKNLNADISSGQYPAGLLTTILNSEVLRQDKDLMSAAMYMEQTSWLGALSVYGDYSNETWPEYLSVYGLDRKDIDRLAERITAVTTAYPEMAGTILSEIIDLDESKSSLYDDFEVKADAIYAQLGKVMGKIELGQAVFCFLTAEDMGGMNISRVLVDHLRNKHNIKLVIVGVERDDGEKRVLILHARSRDVDAGELLKTVAGGGGHKEAAGAAIELKEGENAREVFKKIREDIESILHKGGERESGTKVKGVKGGEVIVDIGYNWQRYGDIWPDDSLKTAFRTAIDSIFQSGDFNEVDKELIRKVRLVSKNDKLASCNREEGQVILDIRSFENADVLRLELMHELWHLKLAELIKMGKLSVNPMIEEMFILLIQIGEFLRLDEGRRRAYIEALALDTDPSESSLHKILLHVVEHKITSIDSCYDKVSDLVLLTGIFDFESKNVTEFIEMLKEGRRQQVNVLFQLRDAFKFIGVPPDPDRSAPVELERYKNTRREIKSVIRMEGKNRVPKGSENLASIIFRPDGFVEQKNWDNKQRRFTKKHYEGLQRIFREVSFKLKKRFMQINVEELGVFKDLEVIIVDNSDHLIYYEEQEGKKQMFIDRKAFVSEELLLIELERIIGETLMRKMTGRLPGDRIEVVYTMYLLVERFLKYDGSKQKAMLDVLAKEFPDNPMFLELLVKIKGKNITRYEQWCEAVDKIINFISEEGIYPQEVREALGRLSCDRIKKLLWNWIELIESQIQIELAFRSHDPEMRNLAINYLVKNEKKLRLKTELLFIPRQQVPLGSTVFELGNIPGFDCPVRCLRSVLYPNRIILVNHITGKCLLVEKLTSGQGKPYLRLSNRGYELESDTAIIDLSNILQDPRLWIGNYSLVDFFGNKLETVLFKLRSPPDTSKPDLSDIPKDVAALTRRVVSNRIREDALEYIKRHPLPKTKKALEKRSLHALLLHIHYYLTLMSTGDIDDFVFAQEKIKILVQDERIRALIIFLMEHLGISKQFNILSGLNEQQFSAVTAPKGPSIVIAGAGTGKTRVIVRRLAHILNTEKDTKPENVLAITFTKKAAGEIAERVEDMVGTMRERIQISTFHSFGFRILQEHGFLAGLPRIMKILDEVEQWQLFRSLMPKLRKPNGEILQSYWKRQSPSDVISGFISFINRAKDNLVGPEELMKFARRKGDTDLIEAAQVYQIYQNELLARGYLDFGDLISYPVELLRKKPDIKALYQKKYKHILVDEFQDSNYAQIELLRLLSSGADNSIFVVGDDDQSIYQFRGASDASFSLFYEMFPKARRFKLTQNYRSQPNVLESANTLISHNAERFDSQKNLWTAKPKGEPVEAWVSPDFYDEASAIADEIQKIYKETGSYSDVAVLYRAHRHNRELISVLEARKIPYKVKGGIPLLNRREIRDLTAYMRFVNDPSDVISFFRILQTPRFQISDAQWITLVEFMEEKQYTPWEMMDDVNEIDGISETDKDKLKTLREYLENIMKTSLVKDIAVVFNMLWQGYLDDIALSGADSEVNTFIHKFSDFIRSYAEINQDKAGLADFLVYLDTYMLAGGDPERDTSQGESTEDAVQLMTVHRAKGLEFPYVFLINLTDRRFPSQNRPKPIRFPHELSKDKTRDDLQEAHYEEERRVMYVGMTRAQEKLYLCGVRKPYNKLSRFVEEVLSLGERKDVLISRIIQKAEEEEEEDPLDAGMLLEQEIFDLRARLMTVETLGTANVRARFGGNEWSGNLLELFRQCLSIANASVARKSANVKRARQRLKKLHEWIAEMLDSGSIDKSAGVAKAQNASEISGIIPVAQPEGLKLPRPEKFSFTQIAAYLDDPQRYKAFYVLGEKGFGSKSQALRFGSTVHETLELINHSIVKGKKEGGKTITFDEIRKSLSKIKKRKKKDKMAVLDSIKETLPILTSVEIKGKGRVYALYEILKMLLGMNSSELARAMEVLEKFYGRNENTESELLGIEKPFDLRIGGDVIGGFIDCMRKTPDGKVQIIDYKTGSSAEGFGDKYKLQLLIYGLWAHAEFGYEPQDMELINYYVEEDKYIVYSATREETETQNLVVRRITADDYAWAEGKAKDVIGRIKDEIYGDKGTEEVPQDDFLLQYRKKCIKEIKNELKNVSKTDHLGLALSFIRLGRLSDQIGDKNEAKRYFRLSLKWLAGISCEKPDALQGAEYLDNTGNTDLGNINIDLSGLNDRIRIINLGRNRRALYLRKKCLLIERYSFHGRPQREYIRIGNKVYELVPGTKTVNLKDVIIHPKYWNSGLVSFFGQKYLLDNRARGPEAERPPPIRLVKSLPKGVSEKLSGAVLDESLRKQAFLPELETTLEKIIEDLDKPQMEAVTTTEGPLLVLGAPGTGKSLVLLRRASYILHSHKDLAPEKLLLLTDSKASVKEFKTGLERFIGKSASGRVSVNTLRDIAWEIVSKNPELANLPSWSRNTNKAHQRVILRKLWPDLNIKYYTQYSKNPDIINNMVDYFCIMQRALITARDFTEYAEKSGTEPEKELAHIYTEWEKAVIEQGMIGNEHMILLAVKILQDNPQVKSFYSEKYKYILANGLQDYSFAELILLQFLVQNGESSQPNICAVGDENMGVGDPRIDPRRNFKMFLNRFPDAKTIMLKQNYRSTKRILSAAERMLHGVYEDLDEDLPIVELRGSRQTGEKIKIITADDEEEEAKAVVAEIKRLYSGMPEDKRDLRQFAVLTKTVSAQKNIIQELENENIPFMWDKLKSLFECEEIVDILSVIAVFAGRTDELSLTRFLRLSLLCAAPVDIKKIANYISGHGVTLTEVLAEPDKLNLGSVTKQELNKLRELFARFYRNINDIYSFLGGWFELTAVRDELKKKGSLEADLKVMNLNRFIDFAKRFKQRYGNKCGVGDFLDYLVKYKEAGGDMPSAGLIGEPNGVYVSTIARAEDRGFDNVFICGITAGKFPAMPRSDMFEVPESLLNERPLAKEYGFLEEARLLYLGMTKARNRLYLTGQIQEGTSKFLRVVMAKSSNDIECYAVKPGVKTPVLSKYQRLYDKYQNQLIRHIDVLSTASRKAEFKKAWQGLMNDIWNLVRLQAAREAVASESDLSGRIGSIDNILERTICARLPKHLKKELTQKKRDEWLEWLRFPEKFAKYLPIPEDFRWSNTRIEKYYMCPYSCKLKYVLKLPEEKTAALTFGSLIHVVMEYAYDKMNEGAKPELSELIGLYETNWSSEGFEDKIQEDDYKKLGTDIIAAYYNEYILRLSELPKTLVEKKFVLEIDGVTVLGFIDLIDVVNSVILDFKTGKPKTQQDADKSLQLTIYAYAFKEMSGRLPSAVGFRSLTSLVEHKGQPEVTSTRDEKDLVKLRDIVRNAQDSVRTGSFPAKSGYHCNWCAFKLVCPEFEATGGRAGNKKPYKSVIKVVPKQDRNRTRPEKPSSIIDPALYARSAVSVFNGVMKAENITVRRRKMILAWDTNINNSQKAMRLLTKLEKSNFGENMYFVKGTPKTLKKRIDALKRKEKIDDSNVDIIIAAKTGSKDILERDLGTQDQDVYITSIDDTNLGSDNYLPVLGIISLAVSIVIEDDIDIIRAFYSEITGSSLTKTILKKLKKGTLPVVLLPSSPMDSNMLGKIYKLEAEFMESA